MLDIRYIRENHEEIRKSLKHRKSNFDLSEVLELDKKRRELLVVVENLKQEKNEQSSKIGFLIRQKQDATLQIEKMQSVANRIKEIDVELLKIEEKLSTLLLTMPNIISKDTPIGDSEDDNVEIRRHLEIPQFNFPVKPHEEIAQQLGILDVERGVKLSGSRFIVYKNDGAKLERALINFMIDLHTTEHGYEELLAPQLVKEEMLYGTGQLPKFKDDMYKIENENLYLISTSEITMTNYHYGEILKKEELPKYYCGFSSCFRQESTSGGKDLKGIMRLHQFNKVEMVKITHPDHSNEELEKMTRNAEEVLKRLKLPYRVIQLCSADLGFTATKTYDIEVWVPSQNKYREISSCSNTLDFQARRAMIKYREEDNKSYFVHTLNGSGLAVGRTMLAIIENYQQEDGSIKIPDVLVPYMKKEYITK